MTRNLVKTSAAVAAIAVALSMGGGALAPVHAGAAPMSATGPARLGGAADCTIVITLTSEDRLPLDLWMTGCEVVVVRTS